VTVAPSEVATSERSRLQGWLVVKACAQGAHRWSSAVNGAQPKDQHGKCRERDTALGGCLHEADSGATDQACVASSR
jgi:hypothetical protein